MSQSGRSTAPFASHARKRLAVPRRVMVAACVGGYLIDAEMAGCA